VETRMFYLGKKMRGARRTSSRPSPTYWAACHRWPKEKITSGKRRAYKPW